MVVGCGSGGIGCNGFGRCFGFGGGGFAFFGKGRRAGGQFRRQALLYFEVVIGNVEPHHVRDKLGGRFDFAARWVLEWECRATESEEGSKLSEQARKSTKQKARNQANKEKISPNEPSYPPLAVKSTHPKQHGIAPPPHNLCPRRRSSLLFLLLLAFSIRGFGLGFRLVGFFDNGFLGDPTVPRVGVLRAAVQD